MDNAHRGDAGADLDFWKGGTARSVIIVDVGLAGKCTLIMCEVHRHAKHANTRGLPPGNFEKVATLSEIESEGIFSKLSPSHTDKRYWSDQGCHRGLTGLICMAIPVEKL